MRRKKKLTLHQKVHHHLHKHFHKHVHKILHIHSHVNHFLFHGLELLVVGIVTLSSFGFTNLTGLSQDLYRENSADVAEALVDAMQHSADSLKQGNIISIWNMDLDVENTFAKWYCTYGAARISPEFFPYLDEKTQQRTRWGNAVDRCKNAADTGYKIWTTPAQWALIVYDAWGRFWAYGHVGKVLHYDKSLKKIIVRDMARVARGKMSDRREDLTTAQVKCYIYNKTTTATNPTVPTVQTWTTINTGTTIPVIPTTPTQPVVIPTEPTQPTTPTVPVDPVVTPTEPTQPTIPTTQGTIDNDLSLKFERLSDITEHFLTQNDITIHLTTKTPLKLGETAILTLEIKDKKTGKNYSWLLPFAFSIISSNDVLQPTVANIKLINEGSMDISILGQKTGTAAIVITMDGTKIGEFSLEVK